MEITGLNNDLFQQALRANAMNRRYPIETSSLHHIPIRNILQTIPSFRICFQNQGGKVANCEVKVTDMHNVVLPLRNGFKKLLLNNQFVNSLTQYQNTLSSR